MVLRRTIPHLNHERVTEALDEPAFYVQVSGNWTPITNRVFQTRINEISAGLARLGVGHGDRVAVMSESRIEWAMCDVAALGLGAVVVSIYPTSTAEATAYILRHSGAKVVFAETAAHADRIESERAALTELEAIVVIEPGDADPWTSLDHLREMGRQVLAHQPGLLDEALEGVSPGDLASLMYTSGTTGPPKGVPLTHDMIFTVIETLTGLIDLAAGDVGVVYLPMSHILERINVYAGRHVGMVGYFAPAITELVPTCQAAHPRTFAAVPRVFEKIHAAIMARLAEARPARLRLFKRAVDVGRRRVRLAEEGKPIPLNVRLQTELFEALVYRKLRSALFGDNIEFASCGAAPISTELLEFFWAIGLPVYEGYGLTETSSPITYNHPARHRLGTVGPPLPGAEVDIAPDGEVLLKGPSVFEGYFEDPAATAAAFTDDGWFKSGDIGHLDEDGFLRITDRKKSLIITAAGKNIAPAPIELRLLEHPLIGHVVVHGDQRKYLTALLSLDPDTLATWANQRGIDSGPDAARHAEVLEELDAFVASVNSQLAQFETIKAFRVVPEEFSVDNGLLTASLKLKRRTVEARYQPLLDEMYESTSQAR